MGRTLGLLGPLAVALLAVACGDDQHVVANASSGAGGSGNGSGGSAGASGSGNPGAGGGPACMASAATETSCSDGKDDDCDGYPDCLDSDCQGQACGSGAGLTCTGGACLGPGGGGLPDLPRIDNVRVTQRGDTAIIEFEPVAGALDYRVYPMPKPEDVLVGANGELAVKNAIYRCAGDRPFKLRKDDTGAFYDASLTAGNGNLIHDYVRDPKDAVLGYVYLTPGTGRSPVYKMADPNAGGGFMNADWVAPLYSEANQSDYVVGTDARDRLLAEGYRDDGIQFYVADGGTRPIYRKKYKDLWNGDPVVFFGPGNEYDTRAKDDPASFSDFGERFKVLDTQADGSVALHRVLYSGNASFDLLAAGEARYQRVLEQGNQPLWSVTWPGLTDATTLVVEALDAGCPFPGGYIGAIHADADSFNYPSLTLDEARLSSGEVFINGQHDPNNRPKPVARAFVDVKPDPKPVMDWFEGFDPGEAWPDFTVDTGNNGMHVYRSDQWAIDFSGCSPNLNLGPLLGQFVVGFADEGSSCNMSMTPLGLPTKIQQGSYLHVRMSTDVPSTGRRYPQLMITNTPIENPGDVQPLDSVPIHARLGPFPAIDPGAAPGDYQSIVVQPFGGYHQLEIEFCDQRGWGVSQQCPQANIYGDHAGDYQQDWSEPWLPVPVVGDVAGFDRPVQFDVYASTDRVYVLLDEKPAGCAVLPAGRMPAGDVNVAFRSVLYHSGIDESVVPDDSGHQYLHRYSLSHFDRHMDDFGIEYTAAAPPWDESRLPCGTRWYGGS
ncbi:MAG TPA: hypothetical protein VHE30_20595 [Polyangiaceae bacterium]|nr:hypothetical protein [Polyangiaceae bacterium]